ELIGLVTEHTDNNGLHQTERLDGVLQFGQRLLVKDLTGLSGVGRYRTHRDFPVDRSCHLPGGPVRSRSNTGIHRAVSNEPATFPVRRRSSRLLPLGWD